MRPMKEFDPSKPAMMHDGVNGRTFEWKPAEMAENYRRYAKPHGDFISWDGLLLDGWEPLPADQRR